MRFLNSAENPNTLAGIALLILLAVFAGPTVFPEVIKDTFSFINATEGPPCHTLRDGKGRTNHQSLIGRTVSTGSDSPISLSVRTGGVNNNGEFKVTVVVSNNSLGTVPILVTEGQLITNPTQPSSGFGVVVNSTAPVPNIGENVGSYPENRLRLLGPRQICVHEVNVPSGQVSPNIVEANSTIKAFYRNNTQGVATSTDTRPAIYSDQGLWTGVVESPVISASAIIQ